MRPLLITTFLTVALWSGPALSQLLVTEVIPLKYRSAADIIPVLKPLISAPGTISGIYTTLVVKTDADTLAAIKQVLSALDRAPRNLLVTVRHGVSDNLHNSGIDSSITLSTGSSQGNVRVFDNRSTTDGQDTQQVRVLEGHKAFIQFGESVPLAQRAVILFGDLPTVQDSVEYQDLTTGFYALPRVTDDRGVVQISPHRRKLGNLDDGVIAVQQAETTVAGRLGEWMLLGGTTNEAQHDEAASVYSTRSAEARAHSIYLRVELVN